MLARHAGRGLDALRNRGKKHDIFENQATGKRVTVARHADDIARGTYLSILRDAGLADED